MRGRVLENNGRLTKKRSFACRNRRFSIFTSHNNSILVGNPNPKFYGVRTCRTLHIQGNCCEGGCFVGSVCREPFMETLTMWARPLGHPKWFLVSSFTIWKLILLAIALASPGPGYDTSTALLHLDLSFTQAKPRSDWELASRLRNLVRWDAIYFTQLARRGYLWEQEWAFGWGFSNLIAVTSRGDRCVPHLRCMWLNVNSSWIGSLSIAAGP